MPLVSGVIGAIAWRQHEMQRKNLNDKLRNHGFDSDVSELISSYKSYADIRCRERLFGEECVLSTQNVLKLPRFMQPFSGLEKMDAMISVLSALKDNQFIKPLGDEATEGNVALKALRGGKIGWDNDREKRTKAHNLLNTFIVGQRDLLLYGGNYRCWPSNIANHLCLTSATKYLLAIAIVYIKECKGQLLELEVIALSKETEWSKAQIKDVLSKSPQRTAALYQVGHKIIPTG